MQHDNTPVTVGIGEITHRCKDLALSLKPIVLMQRALLAAQADAGAGLLPLLDSLDIVCEHSWPYADAPALLCRQLGVQPARQVYGQRGGQSASAFPTQRRSALHAGKARWRPSPGLKRGIPWQWQPRPVWRCPGRRLTPMSSWCVERKSATRWPCSMT